MQRLDVVVMENLFYGRKIVKVSQDNLQGF